MNPELPQVRPNVESMPSIPGGAEYRPPSSHERGDQYISSEQLQAGAVEQASGLAQPVLPTGLPVQSAATDDASAATAQPGPAIAADEDLIEREWVDQLKKIVALTKDDPYERSRVIAQLQADYLKKRYNKQLGQADG